MNKQEYRDGGSYDELLCRAQHHVEQMASSGVYAIAAWVDILWKGRIITLIREFQLSELGRMDELVHELMSEVTGTVEPAGAAATFPETAESGLVRQVIVRRDSESLAELMAAKLARRPNGKVAAVGDWGYITGVDEETSLLARVFHEQRQ